MLSKFTGSFTVLWKFFKTSFSNSVFFKSFKMFSEFFHFFNYFPKTESRILLKLIHPAITFPMAFLAFLVLSDFVASIYSYAIIFLGLSAFSIVAFISSKLKVNREKPFLGDASAIVGTFLIIVGLAFIVKCIIDAGRIPLLYPNVRLILDLISVELAFLFVPGTLLLVGYIGNLVHQEKLKRKIARNWILLLATISSIIISLLGFRTETMVLLLGIFLITAYQRIFNLCESFVLLVTTVFILIAMSILRHTLMGSTVTADILSSRFGASLAAFDYLANKAGLSGVTYGLIHTAGFWFLEVVPGPRNLIGYYIGAGYKSTTATIFGPIVFDFGIVGVVIAMLILGSILGIGYKLATVTKDGFIVATHSLLFAFSLVGIETGLVDFIVYIYFITGILVFLAALIFLKHRKNFQFPYKIHGLGENSFIEFKIKE